MDFTLSDEQKMVQDTARSLFAQECPLDLLFAAWDDPHAAAPLWDRHLSQWMELATADLTDVIFFVEEHGRAAAPGPFFASLLAAQVASAAEIEIEGPATVAISGRDGLWIPHDGAEKFLVPSAADARQLLVLGGTADAPSVSVAAPGDVALETMEQLDGLRPMFLVTAGGTGASRTVDPEKLRHATQRCLVITAAELIGVGRWLLDTSVAYAKERVQFDRPIGSFQGLQWELVDTALALERAAAAVAHAAMCVDADDADRSRAVHGAKAEAGLAARGCARTGMQVHGGIGYTFEHGLHFWLRRAYAGDAFMGPSAYHHDRLAALLFDA